jgi:hypothetical protein
VTTVIATVLTCLCWLFDLVGLVGPSWFYVWLGEKGKSHVGLFDYCHDNPKYDCEGVYYHFYKYGE